MRGTSGSQTFPPDLREYVLRSLRAHAADVQEEAVLADGVRADAIIHTPDRTYVVEVKTGLPTIDTVARANLYRALYERRHPGLSAVPVIVARNATLPIRHMVDELGGIVVEVPPRLLPPPAPEKGAVRLTAEKSWRVVAALLRGRVARSVRALSDASGVSAGWVHRTLKELEARGIAQTAPGGGIRLADAERILDVVPLERPFAKLEVEIIASDYLDAHQGAMELTRVLSRPRDDVGAIRFAFGGYTAAGLYTGYARRMDRIDLYVDDPDVKPYIASTGGGVPVHLYRPDRDILHGSQIIEGVRVVSRELALLDVAGMGFAAGDLAMKLLEAYDAQ